MAPASVRSGRFEIFPCQGGQGAHDGKLVRDPDDDGTGGVWMSWWLASPAEARALHAQAVAAGCTNGRPPTNDSWGVRELHLVQPDGHTFRVSAGLPGPDASGQGAREGRRA